MAHVQEVQHTHVTWCEYCGSNTHYSLGNLSSTFNWLSLWNNNHINHDHVTFCVPRDNKLSIYIFHWKLNQNNFAILIFANFQPLMALQYSDVACQCYNAVLAQCHWCSKANGYFSTRLNWAQICTQSPLICVQIRSCALISCQLPSKTSKMTGCKWSQICALVCAQFCAQGANERKIDFRLTLSCAHLRSDRKMGADERSWAQMGAKFCAQLHPIALKCTHLSLALKYPFSWCNYDLWYLKINRYQIGVLVSVNSSRKT